MKSTDLYMKRNSTVKLLFATATLFFAAPLQAEQNLLSQLSIDRPNIVLILADDLGFTDISSYGGEIDTPNIAALAAQGLSFTNYHTAASCAPTRSMLLTGVDSHRNGVPNIPEALPPEQKKHENYQGVLSKKVVTIATMLKDSGYHTYMTGKWHLGKDPDLLPYARGFERTITMADTGADNWEQKPYLPIYEKANWFADGKEHTLPDEFYSSKYFIDKTIEFIESNRKDGKPFFSYIPFQAVHIPVQAPRAFTEKYSGVYDEGWTIMREKRRLAAEKLGIIPPNVKTTITPGTQNWDLLSATEKRFLSKSMAVYAGMVDAMDTHVGRLISYLKRIGEYDNTVFIFTSDNGAEGSDPNAASATMFDLWMKSVGYNTDYETLGEKGSYNVIGPSNATIAVSPLSYYKFYAGEGGMRVPLIISGPSIQTRGELTKALTYVTDIMPTILTLGKVKDHNGTYNGTAVETIIGKNLEPLYNKSMTSIRTNEDSIGYELGGNKALFRGDYKIVFNRGPLGDSAWHLYNIASDPGEAIDLAHTDPELFESLLRDYDVYAAKNNVLAVPEGYDQVEQVFINGLMRLYTAKIIITLSTVCGLVVLWYFWRRKKKRG
ncbi:MAG: arylsulfatase A-like enzyme [Oceanicoccus sp.]|jgi:arylsulfatase A-like enzyme